MFNLRCSRHFVDVNVCIKSTHTHKLAHTSFSSLNEIYRVCFAYAYSDVWLLLMLLLLLPLFFPSFNRYSAFSCFGFFSSFPSSLIHTITKILFIFFSLISASPLLAYDTPFVWLSLGFYIYIRCDEAEFEFMHCRFACFYGLSTRL